MARKDIVVVGASAGGMTALEKLVAGLPKEFPAALFIVRHLSPGLRSVLPRVLERAGPLPASNPGDGDRIDPLSRSALERMGAEVKIAEGADAMDFEVRRFGELSAFTCPECSGVLTLLKDGTVKRYRCHTGHAYSAGALVESATEQPIRDAALRAEPVTEDEAKQT